MNIAVLLDKVFTGHELPHAEATQLRVLLRWRPWWPALPDVVRHLHGEPVPSWYSITDTQRMVEALEVLRPVYEDWKRAA